MKLSGAGGRGNIAAMVDLLAGYPSKNTGARLAVLTFVRPVQLTVLPRPGMLVPQRRVRKSYSVLRFILLR